MKAPPGRILPSVSSGAAVDDQADAIEARKLGGASPALSDKNTDIEMPVSASTARPGIGQATAVVRLRPVVINNAVSKNGKKFVPPLPGLLRNERLPCAVSEPLVDDISAVWCEWAVKMNEYLLGQKQLALHIVRDDINYLFQARRQLLSQTLSQDELNKLRREMIIRLVAGNISQSLDLIVRHPDRGTIADDTNTSVVQLHRMQAHLCKCRAQYPKRRRSRYFQCRSRSTGPVARVSSRWLADQCRFVFALLGYGRPRKRICVGKGRLYAPLSRIQGMRCKHCRQW